MPGMGLTRERWRERSPEAVDRALEVECPPDRGCGAPCGEPCMSSAGKPTAVHIPRYEASAARLRGWAVTRWA